ncbi:Winged helix-turn-helix DNA-binding domain protein [Acididesulfobacillus acetoxydans]|uniref:Regulatory protein DeoR n=1 Tax=Acididesulfobacillus acetoxydans TaxID=1561005 RepID=A0A8S0W215_9FIRM|nr:WYL domain-containing protein [Acididesulfobacillus acetoxydans]CAA7600238.1 Winged helix-turn-helix DNA-binding domain protein [Acididesulfobacillus acetoxydans]CEJ09616.1 Regulatory protein DeoR [Acididesulfobacillus acetoxydans]
MTKVERQHRLLKLVATSPWVYTTDALASGLKSSVSSIVRDLKELEANGYSLTKNEQGQLFLQETGWDSFSGVKEATLRQLEILRFIAAHEQTAGRADIVSHFTRGYEVGEKTIERDLKDLCQRHLIDEVNGRYVLNASQLLPPIDLDTVEKGLLIDALTMQREVSARRDEAKSAAAKLQVSLRLPGGGIETVVVHGRRPIEDLRRSHYCQRLEEFARKRETVKLLYRRGREAAREVRVNPLGIVYYWALDNWYLAAQDNERPQQIKTYLLDRILLAESTGVNFSFPEGFRLEDWYRFSWGVFRQGNPVDVKIRFHDYYATVQRVREELANRKTCTLREENGHLLVEDRVDGLAELAVWLRGFGPGAEVIGPKELRDLVVNDLEKILEIYGE